MGSRGSPHRRPRRGRPVRQRARSVAFVSKRVGNVTFHPTVPHAARPGVGSLSRLQVWDLLEPQRESHGEVESSHSAGINSGNKLSANRARLRATQARSRRLNPPGYSRIVPGSNLDPGVQILHSSGEPVHGARRRSRALVRTRSESHSFDHVRTSSGQKRHPRWLRRLLDASAGAGRKASLALRGSGRLPAIRAASRHAGLRAAAMWIERFHQRNQADLDRVTRQYPLVRDGRACPRDTWGTGRHRSANRPSH